MLDKHPLVACGPEIGVFNKSEFYHTPFNAFKEKFPGWLLNGLSIEGQASYHGFFFNKEAYFHNNDSLTELVNTSNSQREFIDRFYEGYLLKRNKKIWGEKTGSNAYCIREFLTLYPEAKIIHLIRDARDTVCSLIKRSLKEEFRDPLLAATDSVAHWLYNNAASSSIKNDSRYLLVKYEDLVNDPIREMKKISGHLNIEYTDAYFSDTTDDYWTNFSQGNIHGSWNATPLSGGVSKTSLNKYKEELTPELECLLWNLRLTAYAKKKLSISFDNVESLMIQNGYDTGKLFNNNNPGFNIRMAVLRYNLIRIKNEWKRRKILWRPLFKL